MTRQELYNLWDRYMHRKDLGADHESVYDIVASQITERLISETAPDLDAILTTNPRMFVHGGLAYLHELAQDNDGLGREREFFETSLRDYSIYSSISKGPVKMSRPYYPGDVT